MLTWPRRLARRLRALFRARDLDRDLDDEIRLHLQLETEELMRTEGLAEREARRRARAAFGGVERYREEHRDARGVGLIADTWQDVRYATRGFARRPAFTLAAVVTLTLGIGANTAVFSAVDSLILHPLPFPHATNIAYVWVSSPKGQMSLTPPRVLVDAWVAHPGPLTQIEEYTGGPLKLATADGPADVQVSYIDATYLAFLGLRPELGRNFTAADLAAGSPDVALLGYGTWKARYGASPHVIGRTVDLDGHPYTIVGVAPARAAKLDSPGHAAFWLPFRKDLDVADARAAIRIPPGMTDTQVGAALTTVMRQVQGLPPYMDGWRPKLLRPQDFLLGSLRTTLLVLLGAVGLVLLIACANVASLLLARGAARTREMAVRTAIGAGRARLVRQLLTESALLAAIGGLIGTGLAVWGLRTVIHLRPTSLSQLDGIVIDWRALWFTAGVVAVASVLFGLLPALRASDTSPADDLKATAGGTGLERLGGRALLTAGEAALSVVLLVGAGLLIRTLAQLERVDPGFRPAGVVAVQVRLPKARFPDSAGVGRFVDDVTARGARLQGVGPVTVSGAVPLGYGLTGPTWQVEGAALSDEMAHAGVAIATVPADYFSTMGIPLIRGQTFASAREQTVVVSRDFAHAIAPGGNAVGRRVRLGHGPWMTVVGVVADVAATSLRDEPMNRYQVYQSFHAGVFPPQVPLWLVGRATGSTETAMASISSLVRSLDRSITITRTTTGEGLIHDALAASRFYALVLAAFALLALALAAVGLFGVLAYRVQQRTREIGIRIALGAGTRDVERHVVTLALVPVAGGLVVGIGLSLAATRVLASLLFRVNPVDLPTLAAVAIVMLSTAVLASWIPARRAARVDPVRALQAE